MSSLRALAILTSALFPGPAAAQDLPRLTFLGSVGIYDHDAGLKEPSGLSLSSRTGDFWTVSDDTHRIFALSRDGRLVGEIVLDDVVDDPEGVAELPNGAGILVVSESRGSILRVIPGEQPSITEVPLRKLHGFEDISRRFGFSDSFGKHGDNDGLEGVAVDPATGAIFVVKERSPRLLLELSPDLKTLVDATVLDESVGFVSARTRDRDLDVSGIAVDAARNAFWIVSDSDEALYFLEREAGAAARYDLRWSENAEVRRIHNAEGVAVSLDGTRLFVLTDDMKTSRLFEYRID